MNTTLDAAPETNLADIAAELQQSTTAVKLRIGKFGVSKSFNREQKERAAEEFAAEAQAISASKKLLNTKDTRFRAVTKAIGKAKAYWKSMTVEFPEDGIRLLRSDRISEWEYGINQIIQELNEALTELDDAYYELKQKARHDLGSLYCESDYPESISGDFRIQYEYPSVEAAKHLESLHPEIYQREQQRIRARFEEAIAMTEQAFVAELHGLIEHMVERLSGGGVEGKQKIFKDSLVGNVQDFVQRFRQLNLGSSQQLDSAVAEVEQILAGIDPKKLRNSQGLRDFVSSKMTEVKGAIDGMLVDRPKRKFSFDDAA